jgi:hypothetical protein
LVTRVDARTANVASGGIVFYVLNRGVALMQLFEKPTDYEAFEHVLRETPDESPMPVCAYALAGLAVAQFVATVPRNAGGTVVIGSLAR